MRSLGYAIALIFPILSIIYYLCNSSANVIMHKASPIEDYQNIYIG